MFALQSKSASSKSWKYVTNPISVLPGSFSLCRCVLKFTMFLFCQFQCWKEGMQLLKILPWLALTGRQMTWIFIWHVGNFLWIITVMLATFHATWIALCSSWFAENQFLMTLDWLGLSNIYINLARSWHWYTFFFSSISNLPSSSLSEKGLDPSPLLASWFPHYCHINFAFTVRADCLC